MRNSSYLNYRLGKWVRFEKDIFYETGNIIIKGMLGVIVQDPWGVAVTGLETYVFPIGAKEPFGHLLEYLKLLDIEPTPSEKEEALKLWQNAFDIFVKNNGWCGFVKIGKNISPQEKILRELKDQISKLLDFAEKPGKEKDALGTRKRIATILKSFELHPYGTESLILRKKISECVLIRNDLQPILNEIEIWLEKALIVKRPLILQEINNKAWSEGNIECIFIPIANIGSLN